MLLERKELLTSFDRWSEWSAEARTLSQQVGDHGREVEETAAALGIQGDSVEAQEAALWKALVAAKDGQTRHDQLAGQVQKAQVELEEKHQATTRAVQALEELVGVAQLDSAEELEPVLADLETRDRTAAQVATFRDTLSGLARGRQPGSGRRGAVLLPAAAGRPGVPPASAPRSPPTGTWRPPVGP